jgi:ABC-type polysaccharide/polyol phosphate transport system ATPase subunit
VSASEPAIRLLDVHKRYRVYRQRYQSIKEVLLRRRLGEWDNHWALKGVSFEVPHGTTLGLIGPNGAGKSTTLKLIAKILTPESGAIHTSGRISALLELGAGFQPEYTGRENVYLNASLLGLSRAEVNRRFDQIVEFSELADAIDQPLRTYSSGMYMRLAFAVAIHVDPEILLVDEILAVGDEAFQRKCLDYIKAFQARGGTIVMISHSMGSVLELCTRSVWIEHGLVQADGQTRDVVNAYIDRVRAQEQAALDAAGEAGVVPFDVQLLDVALLDAAGDPAETLPPGSGLDVEIHYRARRRVENPVVGVAIFRNDGVFVYGTNSGIDAAAIGPLEGEGRLRLRYRSLPLLAGTYRLSVGVFQAPDDPRPLDLHDRRYSFRVGGDTAEEGVVRLDHEWSAPQLSARPVPPARREGAS